jgi:hypothetical protein
MELKEYAVDEQGERLRPLSFVEILGTHLPIPSRFLPPPFHLHHLLIRGVGRTEGCSTAEGQRVFFTAHVHAFYRSLLASVLYPCKGVSDGSS